MNKKIKVEDILDDNAELELQAVEKSTTTTRSKKQLTTKEVGEEDSVINCLRKERVIIRHIDRATGMVKDPKHILYGGMAENATKTYTVPLLRSGMLCDVLTKEEKKYLEMVMGLEPNALSIYNKNNNFWDNTNPNGISTVTLRKHDNYLDLSNPTDYIKYKILLANKNRIAPSVEVLQDIPKASYEFVIVSEDDITKVSKANMNIKMQCYKEFGKYEDNADVLRLIIETITSRPLSPTTKIEVLQTKANDLIQSDGKLFLKLITDKLLFTKVLIRKAVDAGIISRRGDYLYLREDGSPLCNNGQEPTFNIAAQYLNEPKHQEVKLTIEAKLENQ